MPMQNLMFLGQVVLSPAVVGQGKALYIYMHMYLLTVYTHLQ